MAGKITISFDAGKVPTVSFEGDIPFNLLTVGINQIRPKYQSVYLKQRQLATEKKLDEEKRIAQERARLLADMEEKKKQQAKSVVPQAKA